MIQIICISQGQNKIFKLAVRAAGGQSNRWWVFHFYIYFRIPTRTWNSALCLAVVWFCALRHRRNAGLFGTSTKDCMAEPQSLVVYVQQSFEAVGRCALLWSSVRRYIYPAKLTCKAGPSFWGLQTLVLCTLNSCYVASDYSMVQKADLPRILCSAFSIMCGSCSWMSGIIMS